MGRAANQNVNDSFEFTVTGSHRIDLDRKPAGQRARYIVQTSNRLVQHGMGRDIRPGPPVYRP